MIVIPIYPVEQAESFKAQAGKPWLPSNSTEGGLFMDQACTRCDRDRTMNGKVVFGEHDGADLCSVLVNSSLGEVLEWQYSAEGQPCCLAFLPVDEPAPERCDKTIDLFGG